jgi:hypothetical protein
VVFNPLPCQRAGGGARGLAFISFLFGIRRPTPMATSTDSDSDSDSRTMRANHAVVDPIFIQYIITGSTIAGPNTFLALGGTSTVHYHHGVQLVCTHAAPEQRRGARAQKTDASCSIASGATCQSSLIYHDRSHSLMSSHACAPHRSTHACMHIVPPMQHSGKHARYPIRV